MSDERVGEVSGLWTTALSLLATLSGRVLELATPPPVPLRSSYCLTSALISATFVHYKLVGALAILVVGTLVEGP